MKILKIRRPFLSFSCLLLVFAVAGSAQAQTKTKQIAYDGPDHECATLYYTAKQMGNQGVLFKFDLTCTKKWGGKTEGAGVASVYRIVNQKVIFEKTVKGTCSVEGLKFDGAQQERRTALDNILVPGANLNELDKTLFVDGTVKRVSESSWKTELPKLENELKKKIGIK